jgi:hypothetical protein
MCTFSRKEFAAQIDYELKRSERYRCFLSLVVINIGPVMDLSMKGTADARDKRHEFLEKAVMVIRGAVRAVDAVSDSARTRIGLLLPETSRQGAEATVRRVSQTLAGFCSDYFKKPADYFFPIEISSFPDASGTRSIASYVDEFSEN